MLTLNKFHLQRKYRLLFQKGKIDIYDLKVEHFLKPQYIKQADQNKPIVFIHEGKRRLIIYDK